VVIYFEDIEIIKRRVSVGFIPNAIEIGSAGTSFHFASFLRRDAAFEQMMTLWKHSNVESYFCTTHRFERIDEMKIEPVLVNEEDSVVVRSVSPEPKELAECDHDHFKNTLLCDEAFPVKMETLWGLLFGDESSKVVMSASQLDLSNPIPFMDWFMISRRGVFNLSKTPWTTNHPEHQETEEVVPGSSRTISFDMNVGIQTASSHSTYTLVARTADSICVKATTTNTGVPFANHFETVVYTCIKRKSEKECQLVMSFFIRFQSGGFSFMRGPLEQAIRNRVPEYYQDLVQVLHDNFAEVTESEDLPQEEATLDVISNPPVNLDCQKEAKGSAENLERVFEVVNHRNVVAVSVLVFYTLILLHLHYQTRNLHYQVLELKEQLL
jgi:hypothetical protein